MIRVGTLCLLLAPHEYAGRVCTVTGPVGRASFVEFPAGSVTWTGTAYPVDIPCALVPSPWSSFGARPSELRPLNDPDNAPAADVTRREPVRV